MKLKTCLSRLHFTPPQFTNHNQTATALGALNNRISCDLVWIHLKQQERQNLITRDIVGAYLMQIDYTFIKQTAKITRKTIECWKAIEDEQECQKRSVTIATSHHTMVCRHTWMMFIGTEAMHTGVHRAEVILRVQHKCRLLHKCNPEGYLCSPEPRYVQLVFVWKLSIWTWPPARLRVSSKSTTEVGLKIVHLHLPPARSWVLLDLLWEKWPFSQKGWVGCLTVRVWQAELRNGVML